MPPPRVVDPALRQSIQLADFVGCPPRAAPCHAAPRTRAARRAAPAHRAASRTSRTCSVGRHCAEVDTRPCLHPRLRPGRAERADADLPAAGPAAAAPGSAPLCKTRSRPLRVVTTACVRSDSGVPA